MNLDGSWIEVSGDRLRENLETFRGLTTSETRLMVVVKSDAYGHGLGLVSEAIADRTDWFGVDTLAEALFALGDTRGALDVIEVAIDLSGGQRYFIEQRRRFNGERDPEDRPTPPGESGSKDPWDGEPFEAPTQEGEDSESVWI